MDPFSLFMVATQFAGAFSGGQQEGDPKRGSGGQDIATTKKMGFINSDLFRSGATAYTKSTGKTKGQNPFNVAPEFPETTPITKRTSPRSFTPTPSNQPIGYSNPDVQNAIRALINSTNRDMIRLIPMDLVQPIKKQTKTIALGSSELRNVGP